MGPLVKHIAEGQYSISCKLCGRKVIGDTFKLALDAWNA